MSNFNPIFARRVLAGPKGDTGPAGPAGAAGAQGPTGPNAPLQLPNLIPVIESNIYPGGSYTIGTKFLATRAASCTGIAFYAGHTSGSKTYRCKLWNSSGTQLASVDVSATAGEKKTATFSTPVSLTDGQQYYVSIWATDGSVYPYYNTNPNYPFGRDNQAFPDGGGMIYTNRKCYGTGDSAPTSTSDGTEYYNVSPVYTPN